LSENYSSLQKEDQKMVQKNELQSFEEEFFKRIREHDAWKDLSGETDFRWSSKIIERFADKWDWQVLSENHAVRWNEELLEKYKNRVDWNALSASIFITHRGSSLMSFDWNILNKFESYWNWKILSENAANIPVEIIERFADMWDWIELIDNRKIDWSFELFEKFKIYILIFNFDQLKRSAMWYDLVEIEKQIIKGKVLSEV